MYKQRYKQKSRNKSGVPIGYVHNWKYDGHWREQKIAPRKWRFRFKASKSRKGSSQGGLPIGGKVAWRINGVQTARKVSGKKYMTDFIGSKELIGSKIYGKRKRYF